MAEFISSIEISMFLQSCTYCKFINSWNTMNKYEIDNYLRLGLMPEHNESKYDVEKQSKTLQLTNPTNTSTQIMNYIMQP